MAAVAATNITTADYPGDKVPLLPATPADPCKSKPPRAVPVGALDGPPRPGWAPGWVRPPSRVSRLSTSLLFCTHFIYFFASTEQFGFLRASPACGELGQPPQRSGWPRGEVSAVRGVGP